jgi:DNA-binding response OmpR family regulator
LRHDLKYMRKTKILYVEDEPFLGRIVKESLESREFDVLMVTDGIQVVSTFEKEKPDICVFDIMLPSKDGYSIAKDIRRLNVTIPIIFVSKKSNRRCYQRFCVRR